MKNLVLEYFNGAMRTHLGECDSWDNASIALADHATESYRHLFVGQWNNFGQLRAMCLDRYLQDRGQDPKTYAFRDDNTKETETEMIVIFP